MYQNKELEALKINKLPTYMKRSIALLWQDKDFIFLSFHVYRVFGKNFKF